MLHVSTYNTIKDPKWYAVQGSDTTMISKEPSARTTKIHLGFFKALVL